MRKAPSARKESVHGKGHIVLCHGLAAERSRQPPLPVPAETPVIWGTKGIVLPFGNHVFCVILERMCYTTNKARKYQLTSPTIRFSTDLRMRSLRPRWPASPVFSTGVCATIGEQGTPHTHFVSLFPQRDSIFHAATAFLWALIWRPLKAVTARTARLYSQGRPLAG